MSIVTSILILTRVRSTIKRAVAFFRGPRLFKEGNAINSATFNLITYFEGMNRRLLNVSQGLWRTIRILQQNNRSGIRITVIRLLRR